MKIKGVSGRLILLLPLLWVNAGWALVASAPAAVTQNLVWSGTDVVFTQNFCVRSSDGTPPPTSMDIIPYRASSSSPFSLASGANLLPFSVVWQDLYAAQPYTLSPGVFTPNTLSGASAGCPFGSNGRLTLTITQAALLAAPPGIYTASFVLDVANNGKGKKAAFSTLTLSLTVPDAIRIGQLSDINFGLFDGISNLAGSDSLCVYRKSGGTYAVAVSGQGVGGAFVLAKGGSVVPISVSWNDGGGVVAVMPNTPLPARANSYRLDPDCAGGAANNASLGVSALATDINAASSPGLYSGQLTVTVQME